MDIVQLSINDLDDFLASQRIYFPEDKEDKEIWKELLEDPRTYVYAIKDNHSLKAHIAIYNWKGEHNYIKIMSIGTHPQARNKGYAHILMNHVIEEMVKDEMYIFKAETRASNVNMQKVFHDFDYVLIDEVENYYDSPTEAGYKYSLQKVT